MKISKISGKEKIISNEYQANYKIDIFGDKIIPMINKINKIHIEKSNLFHRNGLLKMTNILSTNLIQVKKE